MWPESTWSRMVVIFNAQGSKMPISRERRVAPKLPKLFWVLQNPNPYTSKGDYKGQPKLRVRCCIAPVGKCRGPTIKQHEMRGRLQQHGAECFECRLHTFIYIY